MVEAQEDAQTICTMIDDWTIVEVANHNGPGLGGAGYQCAVESALCSDGCTQAVCTPGKEGEGKGGSSADEEIAIWAITVFVCLSLYVGGGVGWHYHTQGEITHPHVAQWKQVGGLVTDGVAFAQAAMNREPGRAAEEEQAPLNGKEAPPTYSATADPEDPEKLLEKPPKAKKKKTVKKKKKKTKPATGDGGEAKE
eukprot:COSAG02_NODE_490_length_21240_cov_7.601343_10_plen_196_part_00